jgi:hypothetical protein
MNGDKFSELQALFNQREQITSVLDKMSAGYSDEWELHETYNGNNVEITSDMFNCLYNYLHCELEKVEHQIIERNGLKHE